MPFSWTPSKPQDPIPQDEVDGICSATARAIHNMRLVLPHFESLLRERQPHPEAAEASSERRFQFTLFNNLVTRFEGMHQRHCGGAGGGTEGARIVKTAGDFDDLFLALPFHSLLEVMVKRETEFTKHEDEFFKKMKQVDLYSDQMNAQGKEQDIQLRPVRDDE